MLKRIFLRKTGITPKVAVTNLVVVASAFVWYLLTYNLLENYGVALGATSFELTLVMGANFGGIAVSAFLGSIATERIRKRTRFLSFWMMTGIFLSVIPLFLPLASIVELTVVSAIFGVYFGLGMPVAMGYFAASTHTENRATLGGITFLVIGVAFFLLGNIGMDSVVFTSTISALVQLTGFLLFFSLRGEEGADQEFGEITYKRVATNRSFILYLIPWIMFNAVNYLTIPFTKNLTESFPPSSQNLVDFAAVFENVLIAAFAIITGFLADAKGRKRLAILGFAVLGMGYASLSFFPTILGWYFYTVVDGIAWGILNVIFLFTIWGDIAQRHKSEKFYVIGALPYLFPNIILLFTDTFMSAVLPAQVFTFASFFLFVAVLPLIYAPETLSEKAMRERELKFYVEQAQQVAQKYY